MRPVSRTVLTAVTALALNGLAATFAAHADDQDVILVLDGSGSMWGQIDGEAKISIARDVIGDVIDDLSAEQRLGLVAYGHNREGDCSDIEEVVPVGTDLEAVRQAVIGINPKGKTPLSASVQFAAEQLQYTTNKATVILVSDGRETCDLDPCAVGSTLEQAGIDFTAHVIGFDVDAQADQEQLQCLADNTGGVYLNATSSEELSLALEQTVAEGSGPPDGLGETGLILRATDLAQGPEIEQGLTWRVTEAGGGAEVFSRADAGVAEAAMQPGVYDIFVDWPAQGLSGSVEAVQVSQSTEKTVTIALEQDFAASVSTTPEGQAAVSSNVLVEWTGPARENDWISIADPEGGASAYSSYAYVRDGQPLQIRMPAQPGTYEVRYILGQPARILARTTIEATPVEASFDAPESVPAGTGFDISWTGPGYEDDWITIVAPDADEKAYNDYAYTREGNPVSIKAPLEAGTYELRYVQAGQVVIGRQAITVTAVAAAMEAPDSAEVGSYHEITWTGPGGNGDWLTIVRPDQDPTAYTDYAYTREGDVLTLRMPLEPGDYELRYVQDGSKVLAARSISITERVVALSAPGSASVGESINVGFDGTGWQGDWLTVVRPDAGPTRYGDYKYGREGSPVTLKMPVEPGEYQLRYVLDGNRIIGAQNISVGDVDASVSGPASVAAGGVFNVDWTGPGYGSDWLTIVAPDAAETSYGSYAYTRDGNPLQLTAPSEPGEYELRYVLDGKRIIARSAIRVD